MSDWWGAVAAALVLVINGGVGAAVLWLQSRHKVRLTELERAYGWLEGQNERLVRHSMTLQKVIDDMHANYARAAVALERTWGYFERCFAGHCRANAMLRKLGQDAGDDPTMPERPRLELSPEQAEFKARTEAQNTQLLSEVNRRVKPGGGDGSDPAG